MKKTNSTEVVLPTYHVYDIPIKRKQSTRYLIATMTYLIGKLFQLKLKISLKAYTISEL